MEPNEKAKPIRVDEPDDVTGARTGTSPAAIKQSFLDNLVCSLGRIPAVVPSPGSSSWSMRSSRIKPSSAGMEASGTGNMKLSMNGALAIGTLDGANVEIREEVGDENFFLFGLSAGEVRQLKQNGYTPQDYHEQNTSLREVMDFMATGALADGDANLFRPLIENLLLHDPFFVLADFAAYMDCQERVTELWRDPPSWTRPSILNVARMGKFSSDRSILDYCEQIWKVPYQGKR